MKAYDETPFFPWYYRSYQNAECCWSKMGSLWNVDDAFLGLEPGWCILDFPILNFNIFIQSHVPVFATGNIYKSVMNKSFCLIIGKSSRCKACKMDAAYQVFGFSSLVVQWCLIFSWSHRARTIPHIYCWIQVSMQSTQPKQKKNIIVQFISVFV